MKEQIISEIERLEREKSIKVILACETGSRAWGFPSPDSDFDVRLIYIQNQEWYFTLFDRKDSLDFMSDDGEIDLTGWEFRKTLRLLWKSNPPLLERLQSPIIYAQDELVIESLRSLVPEFYSKRATMHHYLSMGFKSYQECMGETYRLKTFFYALRAAAACRWIYQEDLPPPIVFTNMLSSIEMNDSLKTRTAELIALKSHKSEAYMHEGEHDLIRWMKGAFEVSREHADSLSVSDGDVRLMDRLLFDLIC